MKLGTTCAQKKLFFNLRKAKAKVGALEEGDLRPENVAQIATDLNVTEAEVIDMNRRLSGGDASLNATVGSDGDSSRPSGRTGWRTRTRTRPSAYAETDELDARRALLVQAMAVLNDREKDVLMQRRLSDDPVTLEELSRKLRRQPRAHPPDRGARLRKAPVPDEGACPRQGHADPGLRAWQGRGVLPLAPPPSSR